MNEPGSIGWHDLTVDDADGVRDFYTAVAGWTAQPLDMGGYSDYVMIRPGSEDGVAGICHARGANADLPPQWIMYIVVSEARGGACVSPVREHGASRFCIIRDPAGAVCALHQA